VSAVLPEPILDVARLRRSFGSIRAVDDLTFTVAPGERHAIVGPNGAGKTTAFNLISGEIIPHSGRVTFLGQNVTKLPLHARVQRGIGRTFQHSDLFPALTVIDSVILAVLRESR
jgi:branched-chain amino acid transport system ATP-binding protein